MTLVRRCVARADGAHQYHYIEEAEQVCDRVAFCAEEDCFAVETPEALVRRYGEGTALRWRSASACQRKIDGSARRFGSREVSEGTNGALYR